MEENDKILAELNGLDESDFEFCDPIDVLGEEKSKENNKLAIVPYSTVGCTFEPHDALFYKFSKYYSKFSTGKYKSMKYWFKVLKVGKLEFVNMLEYAKEKKYLTVTKTRDVELKTMCFYEFNLEIDKDKWNQMEFNYRFHQASEQPAKIEIMADFCRTHSDYNQTFDKVFALGHTQTFVYRRKLKLKGFRFAPFKRTEKAAEITNNIVVETRMKAYDAMITRLQSDIEALKIEHKRDIAVVKDEYKKFRTEVSLFIGDFENKAMAMNRNLNVVGLGIEYMGSKARGFHVPEDEKILSPNGFIDMCKWVKDHW